jgi:hypothetical protein
MRGWTQTRAAEKLEPFLGERWSKPSFSAAERSVEHGDRIRQFTADDLIAFAAAFELPVSFFLIPPPGVEQVGAQDARNTLSPSRLAELAGPPPRVHIAALARESAERLREIGRAAGFDIHFRPIDQEEQP